MAKKILSLVLAGVMVLGLVGCGGDSDRPPTDNNRPPANDTQPPPPAEIPENPASDFEYRTITGGIEITGYKGSATEVRIPGVIEGAHVIAINGAFQNRSAITAVIIPDSVTSIGDNSFEGCTSLTSIALPSGLTEIGSGAFANSGLMSIELPNGLTIIEHGAFWNTGLASINLPDSLTHIGNGVISGTEITTVAIPDSVTRVRSAAFRCCYRGRGHEWYNDLPLPTAGNEELEAELAEYVRNLPDCCDNRNLISATYKGVTYYAERYGEWDLPREFYDNFR
jgi:hypothetical protein